MKYPKEAEEKGISGSVVIGFMVSQKGKILNPKIEKGIFSALDTEALRLVSLLPEWIPAHKDKKAIDFNYALEFTFNLNNWKKDKNLNSKQDSEIETDQEKPLTFVEQMPEFPEGIDGLMKYLHANIKYPAFAAKMGITGRVSIQFIIGKDGNISDIKVLRGIGGGCDEEAMRVVRSMPKWKPGKQNGKLVPVYFTLPILFQLRK